MQMHEQGLLLVVSGPSGCGKGTVCTRLLQMLPEIKISVSATTRQPRDGEVDGVNYYFKTTEQFQDMIEHNELLEHARVYGNFYGTPRKAVQNRLAIGHDVLLEIEMQGARMVKQKYPSGIFIFILPPSMAELKRRLTGRGSETPESLKRRLGNAASELGHMDEYDYAVINDDVQEAAARICGIIAAEKARVDRMQSFKTKLIKEAENI